jgi:indolepyruvate ferredoxin oxidoreductase alpha subunit
MEKERLHVNPKHLALGNEAIAQGLLESGCAIATAYPGTPASEILSSLAHLQRQTGAALHAQWAVNEKIAFEIAYAGCQAGLRTAVSMKQVGLNVAADPLMSAAYMGTKGGFVVISADDPGPHSSQTEQDSRLMAMLAKIPVLDPDSPAQARELVAEAYSLSEAFRIPVMLRPTTRVCHARQDIPTLAFKPREREPAFEKNPARWAATPKFRNQLHRELEQKLAAIALYPATAPLKLTAAQGTPKAIVVSGVAAAHAREIMAELGLGDRIALYQVRQPFPLHTDFTAQLLAAHSDILVIEETMGVIEMQLADRQRVQGKLSGAVSRVGEILPEAVENSIREFAGLAGKVPNLPTVPGRRPTLCAGCPHRASYFAIKKAAPRAIYTGDIGCYTLGLNLGAVDTVLCMGAAISQAAGFYHAYKHEPKPPDIVATIGDSTFFHAGVPALIDAVVQGVKFVLVILDNRTTAMTGNQPTPATGTGAMGEPLNQVDIESLVRGCGVSRCETADPYALEAFTRTLRSAVKYSRTSGPAVVIARHPCLLDKRRQETAAPARPLSVSDACDGCGYCLKNFECPAMVIDPESERVRIDPLVCSGCGVCLTICPQKAIAACHSD